MIYEDLIKQYEELSTEDKNALLVYKSRLGRAINSIGNNDSEIEEIYEQYKKLLDDPKNIFMAYTVFKDISFTTINDFKTSLISIKERLKTVASKITLPIDITVYRALSIKEDDNLFPLAKDTLISTSLNIGECNKFFILNQGYKHYLYQIDLKKSSPLALCPYAILLDKNNNRLILTQRQDQEEIILSKDNYDFTTNFITTTTFYNDVALNIISLDAKPKINTRNHKR